MLSHKWYYLDNKYSASYSGNFHGGLEMKTLNVHIFGSNDSIGFIFTGHVHCVMRCSHTEYLRILKIFKNKTS